MSIFGSVALAALALVLAVVGTAEVTAAGQVRDDHDAVTSYLSGGRTTLDVCVSLDQSSFTTDAATAMVADVIRNDLASHPGWYGTTQRPTVKSGCPFKAGVLSNGTTAPQESGNFRVSIVSTPSAFVLHVYVTSPAEIKRVFGVLPDQRVPEQVICARSGVCEEVTTTVLVDDATLRDRPRLGRQLASGLGLTPPTRGVRVVR